MPIKLSVIICTYNREKYIPGLLESLTKQTFDKSEYEIVFVNNNSNDNTSEICLEFSKNNPKYIFRYYNEPKQGLSHARNRGIREAKSDILIFIDDDALACENYLKEIASFFAKYKDAVAGGGKILPKYESYRPDWMSVFLEPVMSVINLGEKIKKFYGGKFPIGANMYFRKEIFEEIGTFNTKLGRTGKNMLGGEEKDLFNKLRHNNHNVYYLPKAWIYHIIPAVRLTVDFIKKQALGIGFSEKIRAERISKAELMKSYFKELLKWGASIMLFFFYLLTFQSKKGIMIIKFRFWVSKGLITK